MKTTSFSIIACVLLFSCTSPSSNKNSTTQSNNFAVVWQWAITDAKMIQEYLPAINEEMLELWRNGDIENVYYNAKSNYSNVENFPSISYFIKAESYNSAREKLSSLLAVRNGIANFKIFPVGRKWYSRNSDVISENGLSKSYVSVWKALKEIDKDYNKELIQKQSSYIKKLYQSGNIENVYWELPSEEEAYKRRNNNTSDFIFFINANNKDEAKALCDSLPFTRNELVSYNLIPVGVFWLGEFQEK